MNTNKALATPDLSDSSSPVTMVTNRKAGKTVLTGTMDFSADNKSRTLTTHMTDAAGKKLTSIAVYDRP